MLATMFRRLLSALTGKSTDFGGTPSASPPAEENVLGYGANIVQIPPRKLPPDKPLPTIDWMPSFPPPLDRLLPFFPLYFEASDVVVFKHGTCCSLSPGRDEAAALEIAKDQLARAAFGHIDMVPLGTVQNVVVCQYGEGMVSLVFPDLCRAHWTEIEENLANALQEEEVIFSNLGKNTFDDFGKMALAGRALMVADAAAPQLAHLHRKDPPTPGGAVPTP